MMNVTISLDDETFAIAERIAKRQARTIPSVVRDAVDVYANLNTVLGESEFDRRKRMQNELLARWGREGIGIDASDILSRDELYGGHRANTADSSK